MRKGIIEKSIGYYVKTSKVFEGAEYDSIRLNNMVNNFYYTLDNKIEDSNLNLLKYNIGNLKIENKKIKPFSLSNIFVRGDYNTYSNTIRLNDMTDVTTFNHEMLHMATSFYDSGNEIAYTGFCQEKRRYALGYSINEGYTELQNLRIFYDEDNDAEYEYDMIIAFLIERIVGRTKMERLFFNADLLGLAKELIRYYEGREAVKFITYLDDFHDIRYYIKLVKKENIIAKLDFINSFLIRTYTEKLKGEVDSGKIDMNTASRYYQEFYCILCDSIKYLPPKLRYSYDNLHKLTKKKVLTNK